eukprot:2710357-Prymnesium_polylepis.1
MPSGICRTTCARTSSARGRAILWMEGENRARPAATKKEKEKTGSRQTHVEVVAAIDAAEMVLSEK